MDALNELNMLVIVVIMCCCFTAASAMDDAPFYRISVAGNVDQTMGSPVRVFNQRTERFAASIRQAAYQGSSMVVFPEATYPSFSMYGKPKQIVKDFSFVLPEAHEDVSLCNITHLSDYPVKDKNFRRIACEAKEYDMYVVMNVIENAGDHHTFYNTNIVIDHTGTLVAKQRKRILYAEKNIAADSSAKETVKIFKTKFGITFGMVFGSDLLLESTLKQIREAKVQNILVLTAWLDDPCSSSISRRLLFSLISYSENLNLFVADSSDFSSSGMYFTEGANLLLEKHVQTLTVCSNPAVNRYLPTPHLNVNAIFSKNVLDQANNTHSLNDVCKENICFNYSGGNVHTFNVLVYNESCNIVYPWKVPSENNRLNEMKIYIGGILGKSDWKSGRMQREAVESGRVSVRQSENASDVNALELDKQLVFRHYSKNANSVGADVQNLLFVGFFKVEAIVADEPSTDQSKDLGSIRNRHLVFNGSRQFIISWLPLRLNFVLCFMLFYFQYTT